MTYPPWIVLHVPHDSMVIPETVRDQFILNDHELASELARMTDRQDSSSCRTARNRANAAGRMRLPAHGTRCSRH